MRFTPRWPASRRSGSRCSMIRRLGLFLVLSAALAPSGRYLQKVRTFHASVPKEIRLRRDARLEKSAGEALVGSARGIVRRMPDGALEPFPATHALPWNEITVIAEQAPGIVWIGTTRGAIRYEERLGARGVQYFASRRWLPDDRVTAIGFEGSGLQAAGWIETPAGAARIEFPPMTPEGKARGFENRVRARHVRHGLTASSHLRVPGDVST